MFLSENINHSLIIPFAHLNGGLFYAKPERPVVFLWHNDFRD